MYILSYVCHNTLRLLYFRVYENKQYLINKYNQLFQKHGKNESITVCVTTVINHEIWSTMEYEQWLQNIETSYVNYSA